MAQKKKMKTKTGRCDDDFLDHFFLFFAQFYLWKMNFEKNTVNQTPRGIVRRLCG